MGQAAGRGYGPRTQALLQSVPASRGTVHNFLDADGNKSQAAWMLGLTRNALRCRLTQMGLEARSGVGSGMTATSAGQSQKDSNRDPR